MLAGTRNAVLVGVEPHGVHGQPNWRLMYRFLDAPEHDLRVVVLADLAVHEGPAVGDHVQMDVVMGEPVEVRLVARG
jgi:hypothetical protein